MIQWIWTAMGDTDYLDCPTDCFSNAPGPYSIGIISEENGLRNGPDYTGGIIYYPVEAVGPLPSIVMVPGFLSKILAIESWGALSSITRCSYHVCKYKLALALIIS